MTNISYALASQIEEALIERKISIPEGEYYYVKNKEAGEEYNPPAQHISGLSKSSNYGEDTYGVEYIPAWNLEELMKITKQALGADSCFHLMLTETQEGPAWRVGTVNSVYTDKRLLEACGQVILHAIENDYYKLK